MSGNPEAITPAFLREHPLPEPGQSKATRGTLLVVGGSATTPGAAMLAGLAGLRAGAGVLTLAVPQPVAVPIAVAVPEAGVSSWTTGADGEFDERALAGRLDDSDAVLIGPGLDDPDVARRVVEASLDNIASGTPVVLDAFALGVLPGLRDQAARVAGRLVLTPNSNEAARLLDTDADALDPLADDEVASRIASEWSAVVTYQGIVAGPDEGAYTVATGHGGLGTSGSGDVLAGALGGILARGASPRLAACWATYLHAAAGDRLAARVGQVGFLARELVDELPLVMAELNA